MAEAYPTLGLACFDGSGPYRSDLPSVPCSTCLSGAKDLVRGLVGDFGALSAEIGRRERPTDGVRAGKPKSTPPINLHIDALRTHIVYSAGLWEEIVRDHCGLSPRRAGAVPERRSLIRSVRILAPRIDVLVALSPVDGYFDGPERGRVRCSGVAGLRRLGRLHAAVERILGTGPIEVRLPGQCRCGAEGTLRRAVGSETVSCTACDGRWTYDDYSRYVQLLTVGAL